MTHLSQADWAGALARARGHAPFLALGLDRQPELEALLAQGHGDQALAHARAVGEDDDVGGGLRRERSALAVALAVGDLAGAFALPRVMRELSNFADRALDAAMTEAIRRRVPTAEAVGFTALALGKQGARELNYSSDIDPILLYDPGCLPRRERDEPAEAAQRYARALLALLSEQTADGYVFRVDLRLRPASEVSPLAISFDAALTHYESSALAWERAAFIRARAAAGDVAAGEAFLAAISPFVWRRSLDFTALEEIRRLTARIRDHHKGPAEPGPGYDLKRGRGGIREIEFFAQTQQLIHGGRHPALQVRGTRAALDALAEAGIVSPGDAAMLGESYDRLRVVEHRLQMVDDRQTHSLPIETAAIDNVARLDGLPDGTALIDELRAITARVASRYDTLLGGDEDRPARPSARDEATVARIEVRIDKWRDTLRTLRGSEARAALAALRPALVEALAAAPEPERAMTRLETVLERVSTAINLFRLFEARPGLLDQVLRLVTLAEPLAEGLGRHPEWLDALIDTRALDLPSSVDELAVQMREAPEDYERRLDRIRAVVGEARFALGVQLVEAQHDPLEIAAGLARVAEAALDSGASAAIEEFEAVHGRIAGGDLLVLGLGRLGGGALTHASDLDVIYLFTGEIGAESDGQRPLTASLYFNRLAQRVTAALSVPTAAGALYEIDTRLRPQGTQGPLAVSLDSFARYQRKDAWTWEHMALARARPLFGPDAAKAELQRIIDAVLRQEREPEKLRADVLKMRGEIAANKKPTGPLDAKLQRGGLIDCEFIIHYLQLRERIGFTPDLGRAIAELSLAGLLPAQFGAQHDLLTRLLVAARLLAPDGQVPPEGAGRVLAAACGARDFAALLRAVEEARHGVAEAWAETFGQDLEDRT
uniref:bifunctional [glutamate--ammonia ligase]-adenylyl-L-tyrosine phosphorylase/[glutamate--ammonia-ligase] adenylyltransferase n=1 Tax=Altererythrobacter segetis TaxID=1104773 RepID=UPI0014084FED|nr:bifunctional [glutamate--ammonia ligase]-adenylyl-L-tyrosine phosphorylase/[glutamate--ammonia-ligase] adenylyltransferase [Altererythrobacter segetis]